jgi:hypothetical protein
MRQERAVGNTKNMGSSAPAAAVVSKDDDVSETNNETGSADSPIDGYIVVTKNKRREGGMATPSVNPKERKKLRTPMIGVRNSSLVTISKSVKTKSLFVSRFSPHVTSSDIEESLNEQLKLSSLVCTRLKTKHNTYASFHILVQEDDFSLINNAGVWPQGALIAPFYERLNPDQIYSTENCSSIRSHSSQVPPCVPADNSDGDCGGELLH